MNDAVGRLGGRGEFVRSGSEALSSVRSRALNLAFLDQSLPDIAGLHVARVLRRETPELPFILLGTALTTAMTVEAMKLGARTVLEKPVPLNEIVATMRSAGIESRAAVRSTAPPVAAGRDAPRSISERWAWHVAKACEADSDLKTLGAWASFAGLSYSSLCESCRLAGIQPLAARDLTRILRALVRSRTQDCRVEELLDISDRRTLKTLVRRAGLDAEGHGRKVSVEQFLASQRFVPPNNAGLAALRVLLLR